MVHLSHLVEEWVWHHCQLPTAQPEELRMRLLLLAIARHCARDDGTGSWASLDRLAAMVRCNRKTVRSDIARLEAAGELVVWRPAVTAKGRSNRYAVVMGRPTEVVRRLVEERHRPIPTITPPTTASAAATEQLHLEPATEQDVATERQTPSDERHRPPSTSPGPVQYRSTSGPLVSVEADRNSEPRTLKRTSAARGSQAPTRATPHVDPRLEALQTEIGEPSVSWDMTDEQLQAVAALIEVHGPRPLARVALDLMSERGRPTFARAWLGAWRRIPRSPVALAPAARSRPEDDEPRGVDWCGHCDSPGFRFAVDDDGRPLHPCPVCHPSATLVSAF